MEHGLTSEKSVESHSVESADKLMVVVPHFDAVGNAQTMQLDICINEVGSDPSTGAADARTRCDDFSKRMIDGQCESSTTLAK
jgi:hypothetical protein